MSVITPLDYAVAIAFAEQLDQAGKRDSVDEGTDEWQIYNQGVFIAGKIKTAIEALIPPRLSHPTGAKAMTELSDWKRAVYEPEKREFEATIRLLRADLAAARAMLPNGWVMVPTEPGIGFWNALERALIKDWERDGPDEMTETFCQWNMERKAMLSSLPAPTNVKGVSDAVG